MAITLAAMAKLAAQYEYSDTELLALYREAVAKLSQAQSVDVEGVRYTRASLPQLWATIDRLEAQIAAAAGRGRAFNHFRLGRAR